MIVHDLDILSAGIGPAEAHAELIVHADAVLPGVTTTLSKQQARRTKNFYFYLCFSEISSLGKVACPDLAAANVV